MSMVACGGKDASSDADNRVYAVEAGSAGEAAAKEKGFEYNSVSSQADALMEVASGTSDAAIIDLLMAGAMIGDGTSYPDLVHTDELTTEVSDAVRVRILLLILMKCLLRLMQMVP